jgi:DmsE family decaheme c-type cytochrome
MRRLLLPLLIAVAPALLAAQETKPAAAKAEEPAASCADCHEQAKAFAGNPHARGALKNGAVPNDVCATCHGDGAEHMAGGGDKTKITKPAGRKGADETCMMCHDKTTDRISRSAGVHANSAAVNCLTCHSIHSADPQSEALVAKPTTALCGDCHSTQVATMQSKPYAHRLGRGGVECTTCHEPHGRVAKSALRTTRADEAPCVGCHADKRGPFVFQHGALAVGECTTCHEQHGSSNPRQLKRATVAQLCIECHSPIGATTLGSQPPSFHNTSTARTQNCTTCHVAIHGSNRDATLLK